MIDNMKSFEKAEKAIMEKIKNNSTETLLDLWDKTEDQVITNKSATVRGAIIACLKEKDTTAYDAWMNTVYDGDSPEKESPRYYFGKEPKQIKKLTAFRLSESTKEKLKEIAEIEHRSMAAEIEHLIIEKYKEVKGEA